MTEFVHAYNFVQFGKRSTDDDHEPPSHGQYGPELLYGRIDVTFETITPLLLPDRSTDTVDNGHRTSRTRTFGGRPVIPASGIKGALRAAHEAITESRLGIPITDQRGTDKIDTAASTISEHIGASPSDRLFGYTAPNSDVAHRGHIRIVSVKTSKDQVEEVATGLTLGALLAPNTNGSRYLGAQARGDTDDIPKGTASHGVDSHLVRGRKFYVHHKNFQKRPAQKRKVNRTMNSWIKEGSKFVVSIDVDGAGAADLGALLWLLKRDDANGAHLRIGYAKPFGYGSLRVIETNIALWTGDEAIGSVREFRRPNAHYDRFKAKQSKQDGITTLTFTFSKDPGSDNGLPVQPVEAEMKVWTRTLSDFETIMRGTEKRVRYLN